MYVVGGCRMYIYTELIYSREYTVVCGVYVEGTISRVYIEGAISGVYIEGAINRLCIRLCIEGTTNIEGAISRLCIRLCIEGTTSRKRGVYMEGSIPSLTS